MSKYLQTPRSITSQILLAVLIPVIMLSVGLTGYFTFERYQDIQRNQRQFGEITSSYLARTAQALLSTENREELEQLAELAAARPSITSISFFNVGCQRLAQHGGALAESCTDDFAAAYPIVSPLREYSLFVKPVTVSGKPAGEHGEAGMPPRTIGWVQVAVSGADAAARLHRMFLNALLAAICGILTFAIFALKTGYSIGKPLRELTDHVERLKGGETQARATASGTAETIILAQGINRLTDSVAEQLQQQQRQVTEATRRLTEHNRELEATRIALEQTLKSKDDFLARMSHELRTPLTSIIGFNRLLATSRDPEQSGEYSRHIEHAATLLRSLINDILDYSKLQSATLELEHTPFNLETCLEDVVGMHDYEAIEKQLELVLLIDSDVPQQVVGDSLRLQQIVNNLVGNAIKFTERGEVVIHLGLLEEGRDGLILRCQIRDSGIGILSSEQERIFRPFMQANNSINRQYGGTGLGLTISQSLVHKMHGDISLQSEPGSGTTVAFTFLLQRQAQVTGAVHNVVPYNNARVLAYDSHDWSRRALRNLLSLWSNNLSITRDLASFNQQLGKLDNIRLVVVSLTSAEARQETLAGLIKDIRCAYQGSLLIVSAIPDLAMQYETLDIDGPWPGFASRPLRRELLLGKCNELLEDTRAASLSRPDGPDQPLLGLHLLVAEDNELIRTLIHKILTGAGAVVDAVEDGEQAVQACRNRPYDLMLVDLQMPGMDGISASRKVRKDNAQLPIICLTAAINPPERQMLKWAGVDTILLKPIDETELINIVCWRIDGEHPTDTAPHRRTDIPEFRELLKTELIQLLNASHQAHIARDQEGYGASMHKLMGLAGMAEEQTLYGMIKALHDEGFPLTPREAEPLFEEARQLLQQLPKSQT